MHQKVNLITSLPPLGQNAPVEHFEWRLAVLGTAAIGKVSAKLTDEV